MEINCSDSVRTKMKWHVEETQLNSLRKEGQSFWLMVPNLGDDWQMEQEPNTIKTFSVSLVSVFHFILFCFIFAYRFNFFYFGMILDL